MKNKLMTTFILIGLTLQGSNSWAATNSCVYASQLWKWIEGREKKIIARAKCEGEFLNNNLQVDPIIVSVESSEELYISESEATSAARAQTMTIEKLKAACAEEIIKTINIFDPIFSNSNDYLSLKSKIILAPPALELFEVTNKDLNYVYSEVEYGAKEKIEITKRLNQEVSCSRFETVDADGIIQISNCSQKLDNQIRKNNNEYRAKKVARVALSALAMALGNLHRGGGFIPTGSTTMARADNAAIIALVRPFLNEEPIEIKKLAWDFISGFLAQSLFSTSEFVNGGQVARGIGTKKVSEAVINGAYQGGIYFSFVCRDIRHCAPAGLTTGVIYSIIGSLANKNYEFLGAPANQTSEFLTGALLGYVYTKKLAGENKGNMYDFLTTEQAHLSAQDLCVDISDIIKK